MEKVRSKRDKSFLTVLWLNLGLVGCGTSKGYRGAELPATELVTLTQGKFKDAHQTAFLMICDVDDISVGTYVRGYPKKVKVLAETHQVRARYVNYASLNESGYAGAGGAVGGAVAGSIAAKHAQYITIPFEAKPGRNYEIQFHSNYDLSLDTGSISIVELLGNNR
jgi:hypothetical protein